MGYVYVDTSSMIRMALGHRDGEELRGRLRAARAGGATTVSSRLLGLESERTAVREELDGHVAEATSIREAARSVRLLPLSEDVWRRASAIRRHIKTLDSLHVATCSFVPDCGLLTSDVTMRSVAETLGIRVL